MNCEKRGCVQEATKGLAINVPPTGCEIGTTGVLRGIVGAHLCDEHARTFDAQEFVYEGSPMRTMFIQMADGLREPDFDRAFCTAVEFDSPEWYRYINATKGADK